MMFLTKGLCVVLFSLLLTMFSCSYGSSAQHKNELQVLETMVDNLTQRFEKAETESQAYQEELDNLRWRLDKAETELQEYRKEGKLGKPSPLVIPGYAFYVRKTSHAVAGNQVTQVHYEEVVLNHGRAWINNQFSCPVRGIYVFFMASMSYNDSGERTHTHIYRNGAQAPGSAWAAPTSGVNQHASNMAILSLEAGDLVYVVMLPNSRIWGHGDSTFSGFLLAQDQ